MIARSVALGLLGVCLTVTAPGAASQPADDRLVVAPGIPRAGTPVDVTYDAGPRFVGEDALDLRAELRTPDDRAYGRGVDHRTVATLTRGADGRYRGRFVYPDSVVFLRAAVASRDGSAVDANRGVGWVLLAHDAEGRPRVEAFNQWVDDISGGDARTGLRVGRAFTDAHPDHPSAWNSRAFLESVGAVYTDAQADSARQSQAERLRQLEDGLGTSPDPDRVAALLGLSDQATAARWTDWLFTHAPRHPTAVRLRAVRAVQAHYGDAPVLLAQLEAIWEDAGPAHHALLDYALGAAVEADDPAALRRWVGRRAAALPYGRVREVNALLALPETQPDAVERLGAVIQSIRERPDDHRYWSSTVADAREGAERAVAIRRADLGLARLRTGDSTQARADLVASTEGPWRADVLAALGSLHLAAGDTLAAGTALGRYAAVSGGPDADSVRAVGARLLGDEAWARAEADGAAELRRRLLAASYSRALPEQIRVSTADQRAADLAAVLGDGRTSVVVFASPYCGGTVEDADAIQGLADRLGARGVRVVTVTDAPATDQTYRDFEALGIRMPVYADDQREAAEAFSHSGSPFAYVVGPDGAVRYGPMRDFGAVPNRVDVLNDQ